MTDIFSAQATGAAESDRMLCAELMQLADPAYRDFQARLLPTLPKEKIIGVRMPALRRLARKYRGTPARSEFLCSLPHAFYDEDNLHAAFLEQESDPSACLAAVDAFLPYIDNWATCDMLCPKALGREKCNLLRKIDIWLAREPFTVRFALKQLMTHFLDRDFSPDILTRAASILSDEYYVNMMISWFFATALAKQRDETLPYLVEANPSARPALSQWCRVKAIEKACESRRIDEETKEMLRAARKDKCLFPE